MKSRPRPPGISCRYRVFLPASSFVAILFPLFLIPCAASAESANLIVNPGAEMGIQVRNSKSCPIGWIVGGTPEENAPHLDPGTDVPLPRTRSGDHRFGVSIGWAVADVYQYQEIQMEPGRQYAAGFWCTHANGTDESVEIRWSKAPFGSEEHLIAVSSPGAESEWTHHHGTFTPTSRTILIIVRYKHAHPTDIASIHVDDVYVYATPLPRDAPELKNAIMDKPLYKSLPSSEKGGGLREESVEISGNRVEYPVSVGGTMDEFNTHQYGGEGKGGYVCTWQPNVSFEIANVGDTIVYHPRIIINGRRDWCTQESLVKDVFGDWQTEEEKTFALWNWCRNNIWSGMTYGPPIWGDTRSMVRFMNAYGTGACGTYHIVMPHIGVWGGLDTYSGCQANCSHATQKERYGDGFRYFDCMLRHGSGIQPQGYFCLNLDNRTVAGTEEIARDHYLSERTGSDPGFFWNTSLFGGPGESYDQVEPWSDPHDMHYSLRPGESLKHTWEMSTKLWNGEEGGAATNANGVMRYEPRLTEQGVRQAALRYSNIAFTQSGIAPQPAGEEKPAGELVYRMHCPYPLVGFRLGAEISPSPDSVREGAALSVSFDNESWEPVELDNNSMADISDRSQFRDPLITHEVFVRIQLDNSAPPTTLHKLWMEGVFQSYVPSLPALSAGLNTIAYSDESSDRRVRLTHSFKPSADIPPPTAPSAPVSPAMNAEAGFGTLFKWDPAIGTDEHPIDRYEFYLSARPDLAWPLLACFHYVIDGATPSFQPTAPDAFIHGAPYYWRVRARNNKGLWGPWSDTWTFTAQGPGQPASPQVQADALKGSATLSWSPPEAGTSVDHYEIHGGDQIGFTPSMTSRRIGEPDKWHYTFPATYLDKTRELTFDITGQPCVYYRIVAVDAQGNRSVPTKCIPLKSPLLCPATPPQAKAGVPYEFNVPARLEGGLVVFTLKKGYVLQGAAEPEFALKDAPEWLSIDPETGQVLGEPFEAGAVRFTVEIQDGLGHTEERAYESAILE